MSGYLKLLHPDGSIFDKEQVREYVALSRRLVGVSKSSSRSGTSLSSTKQARISTYRPTMKL